MDIHLRPSNYENIEAKCQNWRVGLMSLMKILKSDPVKCLYIIEKFLE